MWSAATERLHATEDSVAATRTAKFVISSDERTIEGEAKRGLLMGMSDLIISKTNWRA